MRRNRYTSRIDEEDDDLQQAIDASMLNADDGLSTDDASPSADPSKTKDSKKDKREYFDWDSYIEKRGSKASSTSGSVVGVENQSRKCSCEGDDRCTHKKDAKDPAPSKQKKKSYDLTFKDREDSSDSSSKAEGPSLLESCTDSQSICSSSKHSVYSATGSLEGKHDVTVRRKSGSRTFGASDLESLQNLQQLYDAAQKSQALNNDNEPMKAHHSELKNTKSVDALSSNNSAATSLQSSTLDLGSSSTLDLCGQQDSTTIEVNNEVFTASHEVCHISDKSLMTSIIEPLLSARDPTQDPIESFNNSLEHINVIQSVLRSSHDSLKSGTAECKSSQELVVTPRGSMSITPDSGRVRNDAKKNSELESLKSPRVEPLSSTSSSFSRKDNTSFDDQETKSINVCEGLEDKTLPNKEHSVKSNQRKISLPVIHSSKLPVEEQSNPKQVRLLYDFDFIFYIIFSQLFD